MIVSLAIMTIVDLFCVYLASRLHRTQGNRKLKYKIDKGTGNTQGTQLRQIRQEEAKLNTVNRELEMSK